MYDFVRQHFPYLCVNSCLINYYPDKSCFIPDHCDDETSIVEDSFILTISIGSTRQMQFKDLSDNTLLCSVSLADGQILIFSKQSQNLFTHGVPADTNNLFNDDYSPRISATFRRIA